MTEFLVIDTVSVVFRHGHHHKEAQNVASLDGTKKSNVKFREHDLWGRVGWMLLTFAWKKRLLEDCTWMRDHSPLVHRTWAQQDIEARCFLMVPGFWLCLPDACCGWPCWGCAGSWGLELLSRVWQWRGWFLLLPWRQTHSGFRETLLGAGNQPRGCGFRVASQKKTSHKTQNKTNQVILSRNRLI